MSDKTFPEQLEIANNPEEVRKKIAGNNYSRSQMPIAEEFLRSKDAAQEQAAKNRAEEREKESLSIDRKSLKIAEEANAISRNARKLAIIAIVISAVMAPINLTAGS